MSRLWCMPHVCGCLIGVSWPNEDLYWRGSIVAEVIEVHQLPTEATQPGGGPPDRGL